MSKYKELIFTNHAVSRLKERNISQSDAWAVWRNPDSSNYAKSKNAYVFYKTFGTTKIEVVAKQNENKEWIVLSVWSKPVKDTNKPTAQKSFLKKLFFQLFGVDKSLNR